MEQVNKTIERLFLEYIEPLGKGNRNNKMELVPIEMSKQTQHKDIYLDLVEQP